MDTYINPRHEADESLREKMTFNNPFHAAVLEGAADTEQDVGAVAILSGN